MVGGGGGGGGPGGGGAAGLPGVTEGGGGGGGSSGGGGGVACMTEPCVFVALDMAGEKGGGGGGPGGGGRVGAASAGLAMFGAGVPAPDPGVAIRERGAGETWVLLADTDCTTSGVCAMGDTPTSTRLRLGAISGLMLLTGPARGPGLLCALDTVGGERPTGPPRGGVDTGVPHASGLGPARTPPGVCTWLVASAPGECSIWCTREVRLCAFLLLGPCVLLSLGCRPVDPSRDALLAWEAMLLML